MVLEPSLLEGTLQLQYPFCLQVTAPGMWVLTGPYLCPSYPPQGLCLYILSCRKSVPPVFRLLSETVVLYTVVVSKGLWANVSSGSSFHYLDPDTILSHFLNYLFITSQANLFKMYLLAYVFFFCEFTCESIWIFFFFSLSIPFIHFSHPPPPATTNQLPISISLVFFGFVLLCVFHI